MTDRKTVAVKDAKGNLRWFPVAEAEHWHGTTLDGGHLYHVAGRWIVHPWMADAAGRPAQIVTEGDALEWLLRSGYAIPDDLAEHAEKLRLG